MARRYVRASAGAAMRLPAHRGRLSDPAAVGRPPTPLNRRGCARRDHPAFAGSTAGARCPTLDACSRRPTPRSPRRSPAPSCSPATPAGTPPGRASTSCSTSTRRRSRYPADAQDVAAAVAYARARRTARRAPGDRPQPGSARRPGGHACCSTSARCRRSASTPGARRVRVGAGVKWDRVAPRLSAHGLAGLHGSSPDVGIAGLLARGRHGVAGPQVRAAGQRRDRARARHRRRRASCARTPSTTRTCSGRCAAAAGTSAS